MDTQTYNQIVSFIWGIADDCLRDIYVRGKYRDVILPMTVIRRLDAVLEETKDEVKKTKAMLDKEGITNQNDALCEAAGQSFCNHSGFRLKDLTSRAQQQKLKIDFIAYLDGFSDNVQEILEKFKFRNQIDTMVEADILGAVIEKFVSPAINLSPYPVLDDVGEVKLPGLDNHTMGTIFEELIRRFNEENNEEAGEHWTPRDVVELMADCVFVPVADKIMDSTYSCYDGASGTGGMLTVAHERLSRLALDQHKKVSIHLFGQEINPETYAITKADMLLRGEGEEAEHIRFGSTLSNDGFPSSQFDFMLSNPPYGKSWKVDAEKLGGKKDIVDPRFVTQFADNSDFSMIPRTSDGQLLFLLNNVSKMKEKTLLGSRIAEVHNGSSLFTGDAGQGESNARRYLIERDLVEAVIALPENMFYNTGIGTFIWILSNRKEAKRRGKIQLIDATSLKAPLRKNLGKKNCELTPEIRQQILNLYLNMEENEYSKVFENNEFGYWKVTVLQPLMVSISVTDETIARTRELLKTLCPDREEGISKNGRAVTMGKTIGEAKAAECLEKAVNILSDLKRDEPYRDTVEFEKLFNTHPLCTENAMRFDAIADTGFFAYIEQKDPMGTVKTDAKGRVFIDKDLTDTEQIPFTYKGGIDAFMEKEVRPFAPQAWVDKKKTLIGYELSFTKYFYKPVELRPLEEIVADIRALEWETDGLLNEIIGGMDNEAL
ncbi:class I SAM-dependent DNA methyltransferase [uncultured Oscillibacter sp.]|uniref:type I restriction-modification system subunit M n=1 Tax=uncultured Oscillibacter sp. TaxID=876091 RepID=UPI002804257D|nr:class I SAM-dependent DNA methyltransferase [uncultured Oscillibacter sp.]